MRTYLFLSRALPQLRLASTATLLSALAALLPLVAVIAVTAVDEAPSAGALIGATAVATAAAVGALWWIFRGVFAPVRVASAQLAAYLGDRQPPALVEVGTDEVGRLFKDISLACTRMEQQLQALDSESGFDALTGLKNWQSENDDLIGVFPSSTERRRPLSISLVDLDGMRALNEHAGHAVGDAELQRVASVLQHTLRSGDWVGRWGGDEFLVACQNDIATMEKLMRRVRQTLAADVTNRNNLTVSVGVAEVGRDESIEDSLHRAERALEKAKQDGADRVHAG